MTSEVSIPHLLATLSDTINRAAYGHERVGITRLGRVAAVLVSVEDAVLLEQLEADADLAAYRAARDADDGARVSLDDLLADADS